MPAPVKLNVGPFGPEPPGPPKPGPAFKSPAPNITLPPNLNRPPKATDLIIKKGFDGLTPDAAVRKIRSALTSKLAPQNVALVENTARERYRDFNVALNNAFTPNTPNRKFLEGQGPGRIFVLGTMSSLNPVVYGVSTPGAPGMKYYSRDWSGSFSELPKPPGQVVMSAQLRLDPPGIAMTYPKWTNNALSGPTGTVTEG